MPQSLRQTIKGILVAITVLLILRIIAWEYTHKRKPKATKHLPAKNTLRIVDANFTTPLFKNKTRITIHTPRDNIPNTPPTVWKRSTGINSEFFNTLWVTIITPQPLHVQNDVHRERHVRALLQKYPFIQRFAASYGIDTSCQNILRLQKITIGSAYYSDEIGHGWVHPGKIGNWCSFLRFLRACGEKRGFKTCVWIENDVNVTDSMLQTILNVSSDMMRGVETFPVVHPGGTWEVVLVHQTQARDILGRFFRFEIVRPIDREFWGMRGAKKLISDNKVLHNISVSISTNKEHSTITCSNCTLVTTDSINRLVYGFNAYLLQNKSKDTCLNNIATFGHACTSTYRKPGPDHLCHTPADPNAPPSPWLQRLSHAIHLPSRNSTCRPALHFPAHPQRFSSVEFQCYSQNTEDGILLALLLALGTASPTGRGRGIEIAGGLGWENNLINLAVNFDFDVLFFDGDPGNSRCARNFLQAHPATAPRYEQGVWWSSDFVTCDNFNAIIANITQWSGEIDVLSIDIDGMDFWLWDALHVVRPRIVVVEIQELWGPTLRRTRPYDPAHVARGPDAMAQMGASLGAFTELARRRGYRLAGCIRRGFNAFFVHEDAGDLDALLGLGEYDPAGCFAHVDAAWQRVLDQRRAQAQKYAWVDPFAETSIPNHDAPTSPIEQPQTKPRALRALRALLALDDAAFAHLPANRMTALYHPPTHGQAARTHTCDEDFGHGLVQRWRATRRDWCVPSEKTQRSRITCYFLHQTDHGSNGDNLCTLHNISVDVGVFADTRATHPVMQRYHDSKHHDDAYIHYDKGFVQADCTLDHAHYATDKFPGWNADWLVSGLTTTPLETCHTTEHLPTLIVQRDGFANLYHSSEDFINAYLALAILELSVADVQVVLTDLYPWGPFAAIWQEAFGFVHPALTAWDLRAKYGAGRVCFDNLIVGIYGPASPFCIMKTDTHCERSPLLRSYADFIIRGTRLHHHAVAADANRSHALRVTWMARRSPVPWPERVFCDDRYFSCTMFAYSDRHLGRVVKNNEAVVDGLRATARDTVLPGRALVFTETDYNALPFRQQLAHTLETDILVGPHGAGLTHQMFLGDDARVIELFIDGSSPNRHFHNMARWRGRTGGMYQGVVMPNPVLVQRVQDLVVDAARQFRVVAGTFA